MIVATGAQTGGRVESSLVPAAHRLPSNAEYLAHLAVSTGKSNLIRMASNENTEPPRRPYARPSSVRSAMRIYRRRRSRLCAWRSPNDTASIRRKSS